MDPRPEAERTAVPDPAAPPAAPPAPGGPTPPPAGDPTVPPAPAGAPPPAGGAPADGRLLPPGERDALAARLRQAVSGFVDTPRESVTEADLVLEETARQLTDALARRAHGLRTSWQGEGARSGTEDTEDLRRVLQEYRELIERLLRS